MYKSEEEEDGRASKQVVRNTKVVDWVADYMLATLDKHCQRLLTQTTVRSQIREELSRPEAKERGKQKKSWDQDGVHGVPDTISPSRKKASRAATPGVPNQPRQPHQKKRAKLSILEVTDGPAT